MKKILLAISAALMFSVAAAPAIAAEKTVKMSAAEKALMSTLKKKYPSTQIEFVKKAPVGALYEVVMGKNVAYTDKTAKYLVLGHIVDMATQTDITQARIDELTKVDFAALPTDKAIKIVKGNGMRTFAVFTDPDCPYCKRLEEGLKEIDNYTMYVFMFPVAQLHPEAEAHSNAIWCADDRAAAWKDFMLSNKLPATVKANCQTPTQDVIALGQSFGVQGTPTLFRVDGNRVPGALPPAQLNDWLNGKSIQNGR